MRLTAVRQPAVSLADNAVAGIIRIWAGVWMILSEVNRINCRLNIYAKDSCPFYPCLCELPLLL